MTLRPGQARVVNLALAGRVDACIVDLDGTLVDTIGDFEVALSRTLADLGWPPVGRTFIERTVGKGSEHLITSALAAVGAPPALLATAWTHYQAHYLAINGSCSTIYAGAVEGLQALQAAGLRLACLTNKPLGFAGPLLQSKQLDRYFDHVFGGDSFSRKKPDALPLLKTCAALGTTPARTLMVGDSSNDAMAARAAGCPVVLVSYGYNHGLPVEDAGADAVIHRLDELLGVLLPAEALGR